MWETFKESWSWIVLAIYIAAVIFGLFKIVKALGSKTMDKPAKKRNYAIAGGLIVLSSICYFLLIR